MLNHLKYWSSINHIERIKTYGLISHLKFVFNFNLSRLVVNMQANLNELPELKIPKDYSIREMDINNDNDIYKWINIVNASYDDANETKGSFSKHINDHPFLTDQKVLFLMNKLNEEIGTVTYGLYKKNLKWGGAARVAILPSEKGNGLGFFLINYVFHNLKSRGINCGESVISFHRKQSIYLHSKCGFKPQYDRNKWMFDIQKRMWPIRLIAKISLKRQMKKLN